MANLRQGKDATSRRDNRHTHQETKGALQQHIQLCMLVQLVQSPMTASKRPVKMKWLKGIMLKLQQAASAFCLSRAGHFWQRIGTINRVHARLCVYLCVQAKESEINLLKCTQSTFNILFSTIISFICKTILLVDHSHILLKVILNFKKLVIVLINQFNMWLSN